MASVEGICPSSPAAAIESALGNRIGRNEANFPSRICPEED